MKSPLKLLLRLLLFIVVTASVSLRAADWQYAVDTGVRNGKAFLWVPPHCDYVRGLLVCQQVILEAQVTEDPIIRAALARENLGILFIVPAIIGYNDFDPALGGQEKYQKLLDQLAEVSGYAEISQAPSCWLGHSGGALWAWDYGWWQPQRCFGVIGLHAAPMTDPVCSKTGKNDPKPNIDFVPCLDITGQYETPKIVDRTIDWHVRWCRGALLEMRGKNQASYVSLLTGYGRTHFCWDDEHARYVAMFLQKAARLRIPAEHPAPGQLPKLIDLPKTSGWLTDITYQLPPNYPTAAYDRYQGEPTLALWHLDEELARANDAFTAESKNKKVQLVTFVEAGKALPNEWIQSLTFQPQNDGLTVKLQADFVKTVPPDLGYPGLTEIGHAAGPIRFHLFGGWAGGGQQLGPDTFRVAFDRFSLTKGLGDMMVMAYHPGDAEYAYTEQPCSIKVPSRNTKGKPQKIMFAPIPNVKVGASPIALAATSDSGLPVEFCVIAGPAEIKGNSLVLTAIPPRSKFPVKVVVAGYQWGRSIEPLVQSAEKVEQTILIEDGSGSTVP